MYTSLWLLWKYQSANPKETNPNNYGIYSRNTILALITNNQQYTE